VYGIGSCCETELLGDHHDIQCETTKPDVLQGCTIVKPEHICVMSGCGAILSAMFNLLGERGDAVLIPAPYYPGFDFDTQV
jgi:histidinol-phosphate/aromatic aminotransferase/cobyric acid decarboxylase-like protein